MSELNLLNDSGSLENRKCRVCVKTSTNMLHIYNGDYKKSSVSENIESCFNISLTEHKIHDFNLICDACLFRLDVCIDFRNNCIESERVLTNNKCFQKSYLEPKFKEFNHEIEIKRRKSTEKKRNKINVFLKNNEVNCIKTTQENATIDGCEENINNFDTNHDFIDTANHIENKTEKHSTLISNDKILKSVIVSEEKSDHPKATRETIDHNEKLLKCNTCSTQCQSKYVLKVHMRTHSGERPYQCDICEKRFVSKSNMNMHKRLTHNEEKQVCSQCGKSFSCLTYLKRHMIIHFDVKPYGCTICEKRFTTKSYLKEHIARHKGDKRFFCEVCGLKFISDVNLKQHLMVHGIERGRFKRHQCSHCPYRTQGRVDLERHIRTHTGERPFRCDFDGCEAAFAGKGTLREHLRTHSGERPYSCTECPARFSRSDKYKNHLLKKHNIIRPRLMKRSKLVIEDLAEANEKGDTIPATMDILKLTDNEFTS